MCSFDIRLVLVGESGVGKTCLLQRLLNGRFSRDVCPTYGCPEFGAVNVEVTTADGASRRRASVGVWDTSGAPRFHSLSRRFLPGADAVLVCWDPTNRGSWDALRAWVLDARADAPTAHLFLAALKSDMVEVPGRSQLNASSAQEGEEALQLGVSVERWQSGTHQAPMHHHFHNQQHRLHSVEPLPAGNGKPPGHRPPAGGGNRGEVPQPAAPITPIREGERPPSPAGRVAADHAAAAAAELVASLTGQGLPSPFAAAAAAGLAPKPASLSPEPGAGESSSFGQSSGTAGPRPDISPASSGEHSSGAEESPEEAGTEAEAADQRRVRIRSPVGARQRPPVALQPLAVPQAAIEQYCRDIGARMVWVSAYTGEGISAAFASIAQEVLESRWQQQRLQQQQQQQQASPGGTVREGRTFAHRSATMGAASPMAPLTVATSRQQRPRSADGRRGPHLRTALGLGPAAAGEAAEGRGRGGRGPRVRSASPSPSPGARMSWQHVYTVEGSQLTGGRQQGLEEEQSCCIA